jgi:hypothetical protein
MTTPISDIRAIINLKDGGTEGDAIELSDDSIEMAIANSDTFVSDLASRSGASADIIALAKTNYAAYLAYQTYADRIVEELPGSFDQTGVFQPIANPVAKQVMAKLAGLKQTSDETLDLIRSTPPEAIQEDTPMPSDLEDYPDDFKISNLDTKW